jgi:hypothetical protein
VSAAVLARNCARAGRRHDQRRHRGRCRPGRGPFPLSGIAGAAFPGRGLSLSAEHRYLLAGTRVYSGTATIPGVGVLPFTDESTDNRNHGVMFGLRYAFGN